MNEFFERFLKLEEWISDKAKPALILKDAVMQHKPPPPLRSTTMVLIFLIKKLISYQA